MAIKSTSVTCPGCGAPVSVNASFCVVCGREIVIYSNRNRQDANVNSKQAETDFASGMRCLKVAQYQVAAQAFRKAIQSDPSDPDYYFYLAIALLERRRPFMTPLAVVQDAEYQLKLAMDLNGPGICFYLAAYIKKDFYEKHFFRTDKSSVQLLEEARRRGLPNGDLMELNKWFDKPVTV